MANDTTRLREEPSVLRTTDGKEFSLDERKDAEAHQRRIDTREAFKSARIAWVREMAGALKTKDGIGFERIKWDSVFYVRESYSRGPACPRLPTVPHKLMRA